MSELNNETDPTAISESAAGFPEGSNHGSFDLPDADGGGQPSQQPSAGSGRRNKARESGNSRTQQSGSNSRGRGGRGNGGKRHGGNSASGTPPSQSSSSMMSPGPGSKARVPTGTSPPGRSYNANHLLNFRQQPRPKQDRQASGRKGRASKGNPYSREVFLQANYRFAITASADVKQLASDADRMIDWEDVVQVDVLVDMTADPTTCPITLEPLVCPHMTACGHIFSFPAIIHHAVNHGGPELRAAAPCPLCFTPVVVRELRCVRIMSVAPMLVGGSARFCFLSRPRDSILPQKHGSYVPGLEDASEVHPVEQYAKFRLVENPTGLLLDVAKDVAAHAARVTAEDSIEASLEVSICQHAISLLASRAANLATKRAERMSASVDDSHAEAEAAADDARAIVSAASQSLFELCELAREEAKMNARNAVMAAQQAEAEQQRRHLFPSLGETFGDARDAAPFEAPSSPASAAELAGDSALEGPVEDVSVALAEKLTTVDASDESLLLLGTSPTGFTGVGMGREDEGWHFYFQALDGQWAFLHPLNLRCLKAHFGSYAAIPALLSASVIEVEELVQSEETRKRLKFLRHLPLSAEFQLIEVDLSGVLPAEALAPFAPELSEREKRRQKRSKAIAREAARDARREAADARSQQLQGPSLQEWRMQPALPSQAPPDLADFVAGEMELDASGDSASASGAGAWANIARMGFAAALDSPSLGGSQPVGPMGAWGGPPGPSTSAPAPKAQGGGAWGSDPPLSPAAAPPAGGAWGPGSSAGVWGAGQAQTAGTSQQAGGSGAAAGGSSRKKGGKNKQVLLFSSGAQRRY